MLKSLETTRDDEKREKQRRINQAAANTWKLIPFAKSAGRPKAKGVKVKVQTLEDHLKWLQSFDSHYNGSKKIDTKNDAKRKVHSNGS